MATPSSTSSTRKAELLERAYSYALKNGLADVSLRPLANEIGSSPRVLLFLFGSKDGLIREVLARARVDELALLDGLRATKSQAPDLRAVVEHLWSWLAAEEHRELLTLWCEGYARSLSAQEGPWAGFAEATVQDWLAILAASQPIEVRNTAAGRAQRTHVLAVLRGALIDLLATGDHVRTTEAVRIQVDYLSR